MFVASIFHILIIKPIFNLLVLIYALLPGHNFGLAIILFTILVRLLMWPVIKKQLHQAKAMRELQPELKKIKAKTKGNKQQESLMLMELYKERNINPFGSIGTLIIQFIILIGLYVGLNKVVHDPKQMIDFSYTALHNLPWLHTLAGNIHQFDETLLGLVDLTRPALNQGGGIYWPAMLLVAGSAIGQYFQSAQLMPSPKDGRGLRAILKEANQGKNADQSEVSAAIGRQTKFLIPFMIFIFTVNLPSALSLYWFTGAIVAYLQQGYILRQDETEMESIADSPSKSEAIEGEVISKQSVPNKKAKKSSKSKAAKKRRK